MTRIIDLRKKTGKTEAVLPVKKELPQIEPEKPKNTKEDVAVSFIEKPAEMANRFEWEAPSFYYNPHKKYLALVVILLFCGAGALLFYNQDTLMAIFLILSSLVIILYSNKKPTISKVIVNQAGITIDDSVYHYKELKSFWLDYNPNGPKELSLEAKKWYLPYVKISIENQNPVELRSLMINFIAEKEHEKSLVDLMSRKIGL